MYFSLRLLALACALLTLLYFLGESMGGGIPVDDPIGLPSPAEPQRGNAMTTPVASYVPRAEWGGQTETLEAFFKLKVSGLVVTLGGTPVPGVRVVVESSLLSDEVSTGAGGAFSTDIQSDGSRVRVSVVDPQWVALNWSNFQPGEDSALVIHVLPRGGVNGRVVDHAGELVGQGDVTWVMPEECSVSLRGLGRVVFRTKLSLDGTFKLSEIPAVAGGALYYSGPQGAAWCSIRGDQEDGVRLQLRAPGSEPLVSISGTIWSPVGHRQAGAIVEIEGHSTRSFDDGTYVLSVPLSVLSPGAGLSAHVEGIGGVSIQTANFIGSLEAGEQSGVDLTLRPLATVNCRFVWDDGSALANVGIRLAAGCSFVGARSSTLSLEALASGVRDYHTASDGTVDLQVLSPGSYGVAVRIPGKALLLHVGEVFESTDLLTLTVPQAAVYTDLILRVVDDAGFPVVGAKVESRVVEFPEAPASRYLVGREGVTDEEGHCELGMLSRSGVSIRLQLLSGREVVRPLKVSDGNFVDLQVRSQFKARVKWVGDYPKTATLTFEDVLGRPCFFDVLTRSGATATRSLPRCGPGTISLLNIDSGAAWAVLTIPGEGRILNPIGVSKDRRFELNL